MADAELHIVIKNAGDPESLGALVNAAVAARKKEVQIVVPVGYRCDECYRNDGNHDTGCSMNMASAEGQADAGRSEG